MRPKGVAIIGCIIKVVFMRAGVDYRLEVEVLRVITLHPNLISIMVILVGPFIRHFVLLLGVSLTIVLILARVLVNL